MVVELFNHRHCNLNPNHCLRATQPQQCTYLWRKQPFVSSLPLSLFAHYSSSFTRPAPLWFIPGQARHASGWWVVTGIKYGNNLRHGECCVPVTMRRILCLGPRSSQPALQTDYPARAHYYPKRGHRIWNFTIKIKTRRSNSLLTRVEKIGKLLYF